MRDLDAWAHEVYVLMQRGRFRDAADALPPLIDAADEGGRADLCARSLTWLGEAHLQCNDLRAARTALRRAAALATALNETDGLTVISDLRRAVGAKAMQAAPPHTQDTPVGRACAALDSGDLEAGERLALEALDAARAEDNPREQVLSLLALARIPARTDASIRTAARVADRTNDRNLVTAVAHAARAAGVALAPKVF